MWLSTTEGYFSIVQTENNKNLFMVRARRRKDLENLTKKIVILRNRKIRVYKDTDYYCRIFVSKEELDILLIYLSSNINYSNFKNKIKTIPNQRDKLPFYSKIWGVMFGYQYSDKLGYEDKWVNY